MSVLHNLKTPLRVLAAFLLFVLLIYILITQTSLPEQLINKYFQAMVGKDLGLKLSIGDLGGSIISDLTFDDVFIHFDAGDTIYQLAYIDHARIEYSLTDIWRREWVLRSIQIDTLEASYQKEVIKRLSESSAGGKKGSSKGLAFNIREFILKSGSLRNIGGEDDYFAREVNLDLALARRNDSIVVNIDSANAILPRFDIELERFSGSLATADGRIKADSVYVSALQSQLLFDATVNNLDSLSVDMKLHSSTIDLNRLGELLDTDLEGKLSLDGDLHGNPKKVSANLMINGDLFGKSFKNMHTQLVYNENTLYLDRVSGGAINSKFEGSGVLNFGVTPNLYSFTGRMEDFNLSSLIDSSFETSFTGSVILDGRSFSAEDLQLDVRINLENGYFDAYQFDSASGILSIFYDSLKFVKPLQIYYDNANLRAEGYIIYAGDMDIAGRGELPDIRFLSNMINLPQFEGRGTGSFRFYGPVEDPSLQAQFDSDSITSVGFQSNRLSLDLNLPQFATTLNGKMKINGGYFSFDKFAGDAFDTEVRFDSNLITFDTLNIYSDRINLAGRMTMLITDSILSLKLPVLKVNIDTFQLTAIDTLEFSVADSSWSIEKLDMRSKNGRLFASGNYYSADSMYFKLVVDTINLTPIFKFYLPDQYIRGLGKFSANLSGSLASPKFDLKGKISSISFQNQLYGDLDFDINYSDTLLRIIKFDLESNKNNYVVNGTIPINLAFENVDSRLIEGRDIDLKMEAASTPLYLLPLVLPDIEWVEGDNELNMKLTGQVDRPVFSGNFKLRNGRVKFYYLQNVLEQVDADVRFDRRDIILDSIITRAKVGGRNGFARLSGKISLAHLMKPEMNIKLHASNFPFKYDLGDISGDIDQADLTITGKDTLYARGEVKLLSFRYAEQLAPAIEAEAIAAADTANNFNYNVNLVIPSNLRVVNNDFDLELGGELRVFCESGSMNFLGTLETIRGKYFLFSQTFTVLPDGEIRFNDIEEFNPEFNIIVETRLTAQGERLRAQFLLTGTLKEPQLSATENSEVGDNQFFEYMSFMSTVSPGDTSSTPFTDRLSLGASEMALNKVSQYFARKIGVETLEINPYYDGDQLNLEASQLRIGFYTTPNLYIYGAAQLDFRGTNEVGFEYRFSRHMYLSGQRDEQDLYHLNMNLNWEF